MNLIVASPKSGQRSSLARQGMPEACADSHLSSTSRRRLLSHRAVVKSLQLPVLPWRCGRQFGSHCTISSKRVCSRISPRPCGASISILFTFYYSRLNVSEPYQVRQASGHCARRPAGPRPHSLWFEAPLIALIPSPCNSGPQRANAETAHLLPEDSWPVATQLLS